MYDSKLLTLAEAIQRFIPDGTSVAMGLSLESLIPFSAAHETIRQHKHNLTLIGPISDMLFDQLIGAECVGEIRAAWVDYITSPGFGEGRQWRHKAGLPRGGAATVITTLGLLRFEPDSKEMVLVALHPGVTVDDVMANTGWPLKIAKDLVTTPVPSDTELEILARFDPGKYWTGD